MLPEGLWTLAQRCAADGGGGSQLVAQLAQQIAAHRCLAHRPARRADLRAVDQHPTPLILSMPGFGPVLTFIANTGGLCRVRTVHRLASVWGLARRHAIPAGS